ncbi:MAG: hypothetical protein IPK26_04615 [Planctomycetes bacterium]|nr:hypothetical protein [Planctomycetota bacterium]
MPPDRGRWRIHAVAAASVLVALAIGGAVMVPKWRSQRIRANESRAMAILKNISSAQSQAQASGAIDVDRDNVGEYAFFGELSGTIALRGTGQRMSPPVLAGMRNPQAGRVVASGYVFQIFLPGRDGSWIGDESGVELVDPAAAANHWLCYAWPEHPGSTGQRWFLINHGGDIFVSLPPTHPGDGPTAGRTGMRNDCSTPTIAANTVDGEGRRWVVA